MFMYLLLEQTGQFQYKFNENCFGVSGMFVHKRTKRTETFFLCLPFRCHLNFLSLMKVVFKSLKYLMSFPL